MALRITEQWIRERVKLNHDNLGMMSFVILSLLHIFIIFRQYARVLQVVALPVIFVVQLIAHSNGVLHVLCLYCETCNPLLQVPQLFCFT